MSFLKKILESRSATIVDVRNRSEFNSGHVPGAVNIPVDEIEARLNEFQQMEKPVVLYCRSGARSAMALNILQHYGISDVYNAGSIDYVKTLMSEYA